MKKEMYLECPQCRARGFYGDNNKNERVYFSVNYEKKAVNTNGRDYNLDGVIDDEFFCVSCSWKGRVNKLKKVNQE